MNGHWRYYVKWNKSDGEAWILYDISHMWNVKTNKNINLDTENRVVVTGGERDGEMVKGGQQHGDGW